MLKPNVLDLEDEDVAWLLALLTARDGVSIPEDDGVGPVLACDPAGPTL